MELDYRFKLVGDMTLRNQRPRLSSGTTSSIFNEVSYLFSNLYVLNSQVGMYYIGNHGSTYLSIGWLLACHLHYLRITCARKGKGYSEIPIGAGVIQA